MDTSGSDPLCYAVLYFGDKITLETANRFAASLSPAAFVVSPSSATTLGAQTDVWA